MSAGSQSKSTMSTCMRTAVVSDIHGNLTALEAVVADLEQVGVDLVIQGGDLVGGSRNAEVIDLIRDRGWPGVYGNADEMLWMPEQVARNVQGPQYERMREIVLTETIPFLRQAIGTERLDWLQTLPRRWSHHDVTVVHAGPDDVWRSPWSNAADEELESVYSALRSPIVVYGHIHHAFVRPLSTCTVANSGSLSFSYDGDPRAAYVLIDDDEVVIRRVEYDVEEEIRLLAAARYPDAGWIAQTYRAARPVPPPRRS
jgi:putative phosphoesterase